MYFVCLVLFVHLPQTQPVLGMRACLDSDWHIVRTQGITTIIVIIVVIIILCHMWHMAIFLKWVGN